MVHTGIFDSLPGGCRVAMAPLACLGEIQESIAELQGSASASPLIETVVRDFYDFHLPVLPFTPASIVIAALPHPLYSVTFHWQGRPRTFFTDGVVHRHLHGSGGQMP